MNLMHRDYTEKRQFIRMQINSPAQYRTQDESDFTPCTCLDLSANGMLIEIEHPIELDTPLMITMPASNAHFSPLCADVYVIRCDPPNEDSDYYRIGLAIAKMI